MSLVSVAVVFVLVVAVMIKYRIVPVVPAVVCVVCGLVMGMSPAAPVINNDLRGAGHAVAGVAK
jgi:hypothetical protein